VQEVLALLRDAAGGRVYPGIHGCRIIVQRGGCGMLQTATGRVNPQPRLLFSRLLFWLFAVKRGDVVVTRASA
jgi:hypothetical protein